MKNANFLPPLNFLGQPPLPRNSKIGVGEASRVGWRNELELVIFWDYQKMHLFQGKVFEWNELSFQKEMPKIDKVNQKNKVFEC